MKPIDENNCTYLNDKPKRKLKIYIAVFTLLLLYFAPSFMYMAKKQFAGIGNETPYNPKQVFKAPIDAYYRYVETYCFIGGVDPFDLVLHKIEDGKYMIIGGIVPTGLLFHAIVMPSYLPPKVAMHIYMFFLAVAIGVSCFLIHKFANQKLGDPLAMLCVLLFVAQKYTLVDFFILGNYCLFVFAVILAMCCTDFFERRPVIGGIIMGIAMVKPQMMVLLFLPFLMQKRYLSVFTAIATFLITLVIVAYQLDKAPLTLMKDYLDFGGSDQVYGKTGVYMGIVKDITQLFCGDNLDIIKPAVKIGTAVFFLISAGIAYRYRNANKLLLYTALILISTIWGYNFSNNTLLIAHILMAIVIVISFAKSEKITYTKIAIYGLFILLTVPFNPVNLFGITDAMKYIPHRYLLERIPLFITFAYMLYDCKKNNLWGYLTVKTQD